MGIIARQSFFNSISLYGGFLIATINNIFLVPWVFSIHPESEWGVVQYLIGVTFILGPIAHLGLPNAIIRFMPYFKKNGRPEFLLLVTTIFVIGLSVTIIGYLIYLMIFQPSDNEGFLSAKIMLFVIPMLIGHSSVVFIGAMSRALYKSVVPVMVDQLFLRIVTFVLLLLYGFELITFKLFLTLYVSTFLFNGVFILIYIRRFVSLKITSFKYPSRKLMKEVFIFALFSFLGGEASVVFGKIDILLIKEFLDLKSVALYSVPFYIGSLITAPSRSIAPISFSLIADYWKNNDLAKLKSFYSQTARNQLLVSGFVFLLIWMNIDVILLILGESFGSENAKMVFLFIGLGQLINAASGTSDQIINASAYYRVFFVFKLILLITAVLLNIILIPQLGIVGAALAACVAFAVYFLLKFFFLKRKYGMQPVDAVFFKTIIIIFIPILIGFIYKDMESLTYKTVLNFIAILITYYIAIFRVGVSDELKNFISTAFQKVFRGRL